MHKTFAMLALLLVTLAACGDDDATTTAPGEPDAVVEVAVFIVGETVSVTVDGVPVTGRVQIATGSEVRLTVAADTEDEVHLHGYDLMGDVTLDTPAVIEFTADIPGIFEAELEDAGRQLVELQVS